MDYFNFVSANPELPRNTDHGFPPDHELCLENIKTSGKINPYD